MPDAAALAVCDIELNDVPDMRQEDQKEAIDAPLVAPGRCYATHLDVSAAQTSARPLHAAQCSGSLRETLEGTEAWSVLEQAFAAAENEVLEQDRRRFEHEQAAAQQGQR